MRNSDASTSFLLLTRLSVDTASQFASHPSALGRSNSEKEYDVNIRKHVSSIDEPRKSKPLTQTSHCRLAINSSTPLVSDML